MKQLMFLIKAKLLAELRRNGSCTQDAAKR